MQNNKIIPLGINIDMYGLPTEMTRRRTFSSEEEATWTCKQCGVIPPMVFRYGREIRYDKRWCPCKKQERERQEAVQRRQMLLDASAAATYTWLGRKYSCMALQNCTFENFDSEKQLEGYIVAKSFALKPQGTLVLHGDFGTGKTHLLAAVCNELLRGKKSMRSLFTTAPILFRAIQDCINDKVDNSSYDGFIRQAINTPLLVLDDIDKAKRSEFREEIYFEIIDERVKAGRPLAISTNRLGFLSHYVGGAVCSRLKVGQIDAEMIGEDQRPFYDTKR